MLLLVCLFLTFVTYSLFHNLRTFPGINSMHLIATLFFLQLLILTKKFQFVCFVKLFVLTGLTWAFQIVDSFLELSILSYAVAVLNGLHGFFLFLSYVCNARVCRMYKGLWVSYISGRLSGFSTDSTKL
ncbi:uncharacterized protein [Magallana gigas]|uniref:uncharacterized protein n=1 Tax=Magallana gigas TaxID=29159 RepID=UPI00333E8BEE